MPLIPASNGKAKRRRSRSSPRAISRRASSPTTKKKNVISPLFTQWRRSSETPASPTSIDSFVRQRESYDDASTFTQTSAAAAAASKTAAPPVSVRRNSRNGVCKLRAQAVRPENGDGRPFGSPLVLVAHRLHARRLSLDDDGGRPDLGASRVGGGTHADVRRCARSVAEQLPALRRLGRRGDRRAGSHRRAAGLGRSYGRADSARPGSFDRKSWSRFSCLLSHWC